MIFISHYSQKNNIDKRVCQKTGISNRTYSGIMQNSVKSGLLVIYNYSNEKTPKIVSSISEVWVASSEKDVNFPSISLYNENFFEFIGTTAQFTSNFTFRTYGRDDIPTYTFSHIINPIPTTPGLSIALTIRRKNIFNFVFFTCGEQCDVKSPSLGLKFLSLKFFSFLQSKFFIFFTTF